MTTYITPLGGLAVLGGAAMGAYFAADKGDYRFTFRGWQKPEGTPLYKDIRFIIAASALAVQFLPWAARSTFGVPVVGTLLQAASEVVPPQAQNAVQLTGLVAASSLITTEIIEARHTGEFFGVPATHLRAKVTDVSALPAGDEAEADPELQPIV